MGLKKKHIHLCRIRKISGEWSFSVDKGNCDLLNRSDFPTVQLHEPPGNYSSGGSLVLSSWYFLQRKYQKPRGWGGRR
jgi:hypothetical protein